MYKEADDVCIGRVRGRAGGCPEPPIVVGEVVPEVGASREEGGGKGRGNVGEGNMDVSRLDKARTLLVVEFHLSKVSL